MCTFSTFEARAAQRWCPIASNLRQKYLFFRSLEGASGDWAHRPWLDLCILSTWSPSCMTRWLAFQLRFYRPTPAIVWKFWISWRTWNIIIIPYYYSMRTIAMQINLAQVTGVLTKAPLDQRGVELGYVIIGSQLVQLSYACVHCSNRHSWHAEPLGRWYCLDFLWACC